VVSTASSSALGMTTRDVSTGGLSFDTTVAPSIGERMSLTIDLAIHGVTAMEVEVKDVAPTPSGWRVGAQFRNFHYNAIGFDAELALLVRSTAPLC
ncbi:MAG: PilZ domain-containing protein, partial [Actinomycetota bacterium]